MLRKFLPIATGVAVVFSSITAQPAFADTPGTISPVFVQQHQSRSVRVLVAQSEIKSDINASNLAVVTGGGMLGGLIAAAQNSARARQAEELIAPVRTALLDLDADALALNSARSGLGGVPWLSSAPVTFGKDSSPVGRSEFLDTSDVGQVAFIEYTYDLSPSFDALRVVANIQFANKALPMSRGRAGKPEDRVKAKNLAFARSITVAVLLPNADPDDKQANAVRWAASNGDHARRALAQAFAKLAELTPRTLTLSDTDVTALKDRKKERASFAGLSGRLIERRGDETLFWANQFVSVAPLS